jgi:hypothetical protein
MRSDSGDNDRLLGQTVLRAPDGTRWVVHTRPDGGGYLTIARRTGCDIRPLASTISATLEDARRAHAIQCSSIRRTGQVAGADLSQ